RALPLEFFSCVLAEPALSATSAARSTGAAAFARRGLRLHRQQAFALHLLARQLAGPADRLGLLARFLFGWLFVMAAELHLAEDALALHLFLQRLEGLVDIVVTNENLHAVSFVWLGRMKGLKAAI